MTFSECAVLESVRYFRATHVTIRDLASALKTTRTPIFMHLNRLENKGLIHSEYFYWNEKKQREIKLTEKGQRLIEKIISEYWNVLKKDEA